MRRTQLYLDEATAQLLAAESQRRGTTVSALVREAVAAAYARTRAEDRRDLIAELSGVWADRADVADVEAHVRKLRRSARSERWMRRGQVSA